MQDVTMLVSKYLGIVALILIAGIVIKNGDKTASIIKTIGQVNYWGINALKGG